MIEHNCGGKLREALTCPACLARRPIAAPPTSQFARMPRKVLKPYTDAQDRDANGLPLETKS